MAQWVKGQTKSDPGQTQVQLTTISNSSSQGSDALMGNRHTQSASDVRYCAGYIATLYFDLLKWKGQLQ